MIRIEVELTSSIIGKRHQTKLDMLTSDLETLHELGGEVQLLLKVL